MAYSQILVTTDLSEAGNSVLPGAQELAHKLGARLSILHVLEPEPTIATGLVPSSDPSRLADFESEVRDKLEALRGELGLDEATEVVVRRHASAVEGILEQVEADGSDLVVIGTRGRSGLQRLLIGSVTERVVRPAKVAVLTVKV